MKLFRLLRRFRSRRLLTLILLGTLGLVACAEETQPTREEPTAAPPVQLQISAHDLKFDPPDAIPAGLVDITLTNQGEQPHQVQLFKLNEGVEFATFEEAVTTEEGEGQIPELAAEAGGVQELAPGSSATVTRELEQGAYALVCFVRGHNFEGMVAPLEITAAEETNFERPVSDGEVRLADFTIAVPGDFSGQGTFTVTNAGPQPHEMAMFKLNASLEEVQNFLKKPTGEPPGGEPEGLGGVGAVLPQESSYIELNLDPGVYALVCFVPDPESGKAHFELGMATAVEIQ
jgi:uncharacterized cupredoxin-like copper-binding protein